jgi:hypothetical protein
MNYTSVYLAHVQAREHYRRAIESGASLQAIAGARNLWALAERRLRLTPRCTLTLVGS